MATATKVAHTAAPWKVAKGEWNGDPADAISIINDDGIYIAQAWTDFEAESGEVEIAGLFPYGTGEANAHLIAASPRLINVCRTAPILSQYHGVHGFEVERFIADYERWSVERRAAIQQAEGDQ